MKKTKGKVEVNMITDVRKLFRYKIKNPFIYACICIMHDLHICMSSVLNKRTQIEMQTKTNVALVKFF